MAQNPSQTLLVELNDSAAQEQLNSLTQKRIVELELQFNGDINSQTEKLERQLSKISRQLDSMRSGLAGVGKESKNASGGLLQTASAFGSIASGLTGVVSSWDTITSAQYQPSFG